MIELTGVMTHRSTTEAVLGWATAGASFRLGLNSFHWVSSWLTGYRPAALHAAATAPALNPHANGGPAAQPPPVTTPHWPPNLALPRRGEARALDAREAEFLERGHIHFGDSDEERARPGAAARTKPYSNPDMAGAPASRAPAPAARAPPPPPPRAATQASARAPGARGSAAPDQAAAGAAPAHARGGRRAPEAAPEQGAEPGPGARAPATAAECEALPAVASAPQPGDVVAYRLLHVGPDWAPAVSVWRLGRVRSVVVRQQSILRV